MTSLKDRLESDSYEGYAYSYPHKTAYRPLDPPVPLDEAWSQENTSQLFLYVHLPFCEMRCGFCNLFTTIRPGADFVQSTLSALEKQIAVVADCVQPGGVAQAAIGGGTPSYLSEKQLERLFSVLDEHWPLSLGQLPLSLEVSPATVSPAKLSLLKQLGVTRLSIGIQSFVEDDLKTFRRPTLGADLHQVCSWIKETNFDVWNLDLIYGAEGQDHERWEQSLEQAVFWAPEEIYLYPLYVGKLTNLDRLNQRPGAHRRALYQQARERLLSSGYEQISMRLFRKAGVTQKQDYCCQQDGMVGLGPGARSYTQELHYSTDYAVGQEGVRSIIRAFSELDYRVAHYGVRLNDEEQMRRFVIKSLLRAEGLSKTDFSARFGSDVLAVFTDLRELFELSLAESFQDSIRLTAEGLAFTDTIGPWLYSDVVKHSMGEFQLR